MSARVQKLSIGLLPSIANPTWIKTLQDKAKVLGWGSNPMDKTQDRREEEMRAECATGYWSLLCVASKRVYPMLAHLVPPIAKELIHLQL